MAVQVEYKQDTLIIGFSGEYYCLWEVWNHWYTGNPMAHYIKRLSKDLEKAKAKAPRAIVDLDVRGEKWTIEYKPMTKKEQREEDRRADYFLFGKYNGTKIMDCEDSGYVSWYYQETESQYAEMALMQFGYRWLNNQWVSPEYFDSHIERLRREAYLKTLIQGHHETDKTRLELKIKLLGSFSFEGYYGTTFIKTYEDDQKRIFKYMGGSPPDIDDDEFVSVRATISHDEYNGQKETKLKRIAIKK